VRGTDRDLGSHSIEKLFEETTTIDPGLGEPFLIHELYLYRALQVRPHSVELFKRVFARTCVRKRGGGGRKGRVGVKERGEREKLHLEHTSTGDR
jgi:hypothetical protein